MTGNGKRQILSIHIPGEVPDLLSLHLHVMDHDLTALSDATAGFIPHDALRGLTADRPRVAAALWRETLVDASIFREWIVVSRSPAACRIAHLVTELANRLKAVGLSAGENFQLPMTQVDLADALGLTPVHVNRVMQELRKGGLLDFRRNVVTLNDAPKLRELADFDELYLHQSAAS
jgi:CRP-like cAMP-binding protein